MQQHQRQQLLLVLVVAAYCLELFGTAAIVVLFRRMIVARLQSVLQWPARVVVASVLQWRQRSSGDRTGSKQQQQRWRRQLQRRQQQQHRVVALGSTRSSSRSYGVNTAAMAAKKQRRQDWE
jgi:uncharacterized oligopeptide transporter (OPT) family protein